MNTRLVALDFITNCLSVLGTPEVSDTLLAVIKSKHFNWKTVVNIANTQLVTPALWVALMKKELVEWMPFDICEYLRELHRLNTVRNDHLRVQIIEAVRQLNSINVEPILLKGSASLFVKTFDDPGSRIMANIDILVPKKRQVIAGIYYILLDIIL
jgi:hypothetical protein